MTGGGDIAHLEWTKKPLRREFEGYRDHAGSGYQVPAEHVGRGTCCFLREYSILNRTPEKRR